MSSETSPDVLWTGFEPFGSHESNPSIQVARAAHRTTPSSIDSAVDILPVRYDAVVSWIREHVTTASSPPRYLIHTGLAASRDQISLEQRAHNVPGERPDERGERHPRPLSASVDDIATSIDVTPWLDQLRDRCASAFDRGWQLSDDVGSYVCNMLYLHSLRAVREVRKQGQESQSIFIHVPQLSLERARMLGGYLSDTIVALEGLD